MRRARANPLLTKQPLDWVQPADPCAGPEHGRLVLPGGGGPGMRYPGCCCNNRSARPWEGGVWISSRISCLPGGLNPHWFSSPDAMWAPLPISFALGLGYLHGVSTPCSWGGGSFAAKIPLWLLCLHTWVWEPVLSGSPPFLPVSLWLLL